jgi:murein DD-endopeptidase MepM/ murein hydrolase activator NlpD
MTSMKWALPAALFSIIIVAATLGSGDAFARDRGDRGGPSPEAREFIDSLSRDERREYRALSRRERRAFIEERMGNRRRDAPERSRPVSAVTNDAAVETLDGFVPPNKISADVRLMVGKNARGNSDKAVEIQQARGGIETGLRAEFIGGGDCPEIDSEQWAIDYSHKRNRAAIHKGIDIPQPEGTPIRAVAEGVVVGKFANKVNRKGIEIMLRHTPAQTGLPFWTYSQYTHLLEMSPLPIGAKVALGQEIGKTSNSGKMGRRIRRDALHFAILYSKRPGWSRDGRFVAPEDGYWMDPNSFYRNAPPWESQALSQLPDDRKSVKVPYMKQDGSFVRPGTKRIWPYVCR